MPRFLPFALFFMIGTTLMGVLIVAALTAGKNTAQPIMLAAAAGFVLALPVTWIISKKIS